MEAAHEPPRSPVPSVEAETPPSVKEVTGWVLYDLSNTIFALGIVSLYFPIWVVGVMGGSDANLSYALSISMAIIFIASPLLGALSDQAPRRMPFLIVSTLVAVTFTALIGQGGLILSLVFFAIANIGYQAGAQFYDALLPEVSTEENRGKISGIGVGIGYFGSIVAIGLGTVLLGDTAGLTTAEQSARYVHVFQGVAITFLLFALPCFFFVRERPHHNRQFSLGAVGAAVRQVGNTVRSTRRYPGLVRFLLGRLFYTDAVNTVVAFLGIYITQEVGFADDEVQYVLLVSIIAAIIGGLLWSRVVDRWGPKRSLIVVLFMWMVVFVVTAAVGLFNLPNQIIWGVACATGVALAGTWAADRPLMLRLTPPDRVGEFYGLYGMVGRFAAITGPLLWALIVDTLGWGRPAAVLTLLVGVVISYLIIRGVSDERRDWAALQGDAAVTPPVQASDDEGDEGRKPDQ